MRKLEQIHIRPGWHVWVILQKLKIFHSIIRFVTINIRVTKESVGREVGARERKLVKVPVSCNHYLWIIEIPKQEPRRRALKKRERASLQVYLTKVSHS